MLEKRNFTDGIITGTMQGPRPTSKPNIYSF